MTTSKHAVVALALLAPLYALGVEPSPHRPVRFAIDPTMSEPEMVLRAAEEWNHALGFEAFQRVDSHAREPHLLVTMLPHGERVEHVGWTTGQRLDPHDPSTTVGTMKIRVAVIGVLPDHYRLGVYVHEFGHVFRLEHEDAPDSVMHAPLFANWKFSAKTLDGARRAMRMR